jgi:hypothetical protein
LEAATSILFEVKVTSKDKNMFGCAVYAMQSQSYAQEN